MIRMISVFFFLMTPLAFGATPRATVILLKGKALYIPRGKSKAKKLKKRDKLTSGTRIRTRKKSFVKLLLSDMSEILYWAWTDRFELRSPGPGLATREN